MADNKQYITLVQENGTLLISEDVVAAIVAYALGEVEGVVGLNTKAISDIAELIGKKNKGVKITITEDNALTVDCNIIVCYGLSVVDVAKAAQLAVTNAISAMAGVDISSVNINVCGIARQ